MVIAEAGCPTANTSLTLYIINFGTELFLSNQTDHWAPNPDTMPQTELTWFVCLRDDYPSKTADVSIHKAYLPEQTLSVDWVTHKVILVTNSANPTNWTIKTGANWGAIYTRDEQLNPWCLSKGYMVTVCDWANSEAFIFFPAIGSHQVTMTISYADFFRPDVNARLRFDSNTSLGFLDAPSSKFIRSRWFTFVRRAGDDISHDWNEYSIFTHQYWFWCSSFEQTWQRVRCEKWSPIPIELRGEWTARRFSKGSDTVHFGDALSKWEVADRWFAADDIVAREQKQMEAQEWKLQFQLQEEFGKIAIKNKNY